MRARRHDDLAGRAAKGLPPFREVSDRARRWHEGRARGQREMVERVDSCSTTAAMLACSGCGDAPFEPQPVRCGKWRYCNSCKGWRCNKYRAAADGGIEWQRRRFQREMQRRVAKWSERFLTLTVPHSGSAAADLAVLHESWKRFIVLVRDWVTVRERRFGRHDAPKIKRKRVHVPYLRTMELTGSDEGHAHCHVWLLSPYLPHAVLRALWGRALRSHYVPVRRVSNIGRVDFDVTWAEGLEPEPAAPPIDTDVGDDTDSARARHEARELDELTTYRRKRGALSYLPWPVLDIRGVNPEQGLGAELVKYLTKDIGPSGEKLSPFEYGNLVEATEGRRLICAARRFWMRKAVKLCPCCAKPYVLLAIGIDGGHEVHAGVSSRGPPLT